MSCIKFTIDRELVEYERERETETECHCCVYNIQSPNRILLELWRLIIVLMDCLPTQSITWVDLYDQVALGVGRGLSLTKLLCGLPLQISERRTKHSGKEVG